MTDDNALMDSEFDDSGGFLSPEDKLFEVDGHGEGMSGSTKEDWYHLVNGYKDAADLLVTHVIEQRRGR